MCIVTVPMNNGIGAVIVLMIHGVDLCNITVHVTHGLGALTMPMIHGVGLCNITVPLSQVCISGHSVI